MGRYCFHRCLSTPGGGGVPHLHPILQLVMSFPRGYPSDWSQVPSRGGVPSPGQDRGTPASSRWGGEGYHSQVQMGLSMMGCPLARSEQGVPQHGYPLSWDVIPPARSEWGYPRTRYPNPGLGYPPPQPGQDGSTPGQGSPHNGMGSPLARSGQGTYPRMGYPHPGMGPPPVLGWGTPPG